MQDVDRFQGKRLFWRMMCGQESVNQVLLMQYMAQCSSFMIMMVDKPVE
jgi:hypothetical protein